ncbi:MFS transporter [Solidesulfovibrio sp.]
MTATAAPSERLWTYDFTALTLAAGFAFCNIAIFYGFASYLERLGVDPAWRGVLLGAEPLAALIVRPFLGVLVTPAKALGLARVSLAAMGAALCSYQLAPGIAALLAVRVFHGLAFVCLVSAIIVLLSQIIPKPLAGRAFGYFSLSSLVPYAVMPPLVEWLLPSVGNEARAYAYASVLVLPALAMLIPLGARFGRGAGGLTAVGRPTAAMIRENLGRLPVVLVLAANLFVFLSSTLVFFFIKPFAVGLGMRDPGLFFTVSTGASIAVRVLAGPFYDRLPRHALLVVALAGLAGCMALFAGTTDETRLLAVAGGYGLCLGVAMPLQNAVMFGHSPPHLRGLNMNLMLFMMDAGYVVGPVTGGALLAAGAGYPMLFLVCAACAAVAGGLVAPLALREWRQRRDAAGT